MNISPSNLTLPSEPEPMLKLRLYVAGSALNSLRARANLHALCEEHFSARYVLEVVDIFEEPLQALADKVLMTPMLIKLAPTPSARIAGDLSDQTNVLLALQAGMRDP